MKDNPSDDQFQDDEAPEPTVGATTLTRSELEALDESMREFERGEVSEPVNDSARRLLGILADVDEDDDE